MPIIEIAHRLAGRLRLRIWWLRREPARAAELADALAALDGVVRVEVRRFTGSLLIEYDASLVDEARLVGAVAAKIGGQVVAPGTEPDAEYDELARTAYAEGAQVARAATAFVKGVDAKILLWTEGSADAGTAAALTFLAGGALEVVATGELPMPPWFQLAWWAFRTFTALEERTIEATQHPLDRAVH
jgi:hypothetical protein